MDRDPDIYEDFNPLGINDNNFKVTILNCTLLYISYRINAGYLTINPMVEIPIELLLKDRGVEKNKFINAIAKSRYIFFKGCVNNGESRGRAEKTN